MKAAKFTLRNLERLWRELDARELGCTLEIRGVDADTVIDILRTFGPHQVTLTDGRVTWAKWDDRLKDIVECDRP